MDKKEGKGSKERFEDEGTGKVQRSQEKRRKREATGPLRRPGRTFIHSFAFWELESLKEKRNIRVNASISSKIKPIYQSRTASATLSSI